MSLPYKYTTNVTATGLKLMTIGQSKMVGSTCQSSKHRWFAWLNKMDSERVRLYFAMDQGPVPCSAVCSLVLTNKLGVETIKSKEILTWQSNSASPNWVILSFSEMIEKGWYTASEDSLSWRVEWEVPEEYEPVRVPFLTSVSCAEWKDLKVGASTRTGPLITTPKHRFFPWIYKANDSTIRIFLAMDQGPLPCSAIATLTCIHASTGENFVKAKRERLSWLSHTNSPNFIDLDVPSLIRDGIYAADKFTFRIQWEVPEESDPQTLPPFITTATVDNIKDVKIGESKRVGNLVRTAKHRFFPWLYKADSNTLHFYLACDEGTVPVSAVNCSLSVLNQNNRVGHLKSGPRDTISWLSNKGSAKWCELRLDDAAAQGLYVPKDDTITFRVEWECPEETDLQSTAPFVLTGSATGIKSLSHGATHRIGKTLKTLRYRWFPWITKLDDDRFSFWLAMDDGPLPVTATATLAFIHSTLYTGTVKSVKTLTWTSNSSSPAWADFKLSSLADEGFYNRTDDIFNFRIEWTVTQESDRKGASVSSLTSALAPLSLSGGGSPSTTDSDVGGYMWDTAPDRWSPKISVTGDGKVARGAAGTSGIVGIVFAKKQFTSGKHSWEVKVDGDATSIQYTHIGVCYCHSEGISPLRHTSTNNDTQGQQAFHYEFDGDVRGPIGERKFGTAIKPGDRVGVILDCDRGEVSFTLNGTTVNNTVAFRFTAPPSHPMTPFCVLGSPGVTVTMLGPPAGSSSTTTGSTTTGSTAAATTTASVEKITLGCEIPHANIGASRILTITIKNDRSLPIRDAKVSLLGSSYWSTAEEKVGEIGSRTEKTVKLVCSTATALVDTLQEKFTIALHDGYTELTRQSFAETFNVFNPAFTLFSNYPCPKSKLNIYLAGARGIGKASLIQSFFTLLLDDKTMVLKDTPGLADTAAAACTAPRLRYHDIPSSHLRFWDVRVKNDDRKGIDWSPILKGNLPSGWDVERGYKSSADVSTITAKEHRLPHAVVYAIDCKAMSRDDDLSLIRTHISDLKKMGIEPFIILTRPDQMDASFRTNPYRDIEAISTLKRRCENNFEVPASHIFPICGYLRETKRAFELDRYFYKVLDAFCSSAYTYMGKKTETDAERKKKATEDKEWLVAFEINPTELDPKPEDRRIEASPYFIGRGSYGVVYRGTWTVRGQKKLVAVKTLKKPPGTSADAIVKEIVAEFKSISELSHRNVVTIHGACVKDPKNCCIVMELAEYGSLQSILYGEEDDGYGELGWNLRIPLVEDISCGMLRLHTKNVIHRDLKSGNILVRGDWSACVTDFGLSKATTGSMVHMTKDVGTVLWQAPEVKSGTYGFPSDVYSFGMLMYEVMTRKPPYYNQLDEIRKRGYPTGPPMVPDEKACPARKGTPADYEKLMLQCLDRDPTKRPGFAEIYTRLRDISRLVVDSSVAPVAPPRSRIAKELKDTALAPLLETGKYSQPDLVPPAKTATLMGSITTTDDRESSVARGRLQDLGLSLMPDSAPVDDAPVEFNQQRPMSPTPVTSASIFMTRKADGGEDDGLSGVSRPSSPLPVSRAGPTGSIGSPSSPGLELKSSGGGGGGGELPSSGKYTEEQWLAFFKQADFDPAHAAKCAKNFFKEKIQIQDVTTLEKGDLDELGVSSMGERKAVQRLAAQLTGKA